MASWVIHCYPACFFCIDKSGNNILFDQIAYLPYNFDHLMSDSENDTDLADQPPSCIYWPLSSWVPSTLLFVDGKVLFFNPHCLVKKIKNHVRIFVHCRDYRVIGIY
ncbi:MAG TPA: hypothetical protein VLL52_15580 [Anaerolineae bacterium]|nr:hypothetical protein [Anaerolineae bacterium]